MVQTRIGRLKRLLSITKRPNRFWRPDLGLLKEDKLLPKIVFGHPQFEKTYDVLDGRGSSFRQYRPPPKPKPFISRDSADYTEDNLHELLGKFRFEATGIFWQRGEKAEREAFDTAYNLHLVGWLKVRKSFMLGHLQGDVFALSYFQRWLEEKHLSPEAGTMENVQLWEVNTGIDKPLKYGFLRCVKDRRMYGKKKVQIQKTIENEQVIRMERESALSRKEKESFQDEFCYRNY